MKKIYLFLIALVALSAQSWASISYTYQGKTLYYNYSTISGRAAVTYQNSSSPRYTNLTGSLTIPSSITYNGTTYAVTAIGEYAFAGCSGLTSVTIPNSVTSIGDRAFSGCSGLTSVTIPNSVTSIGNYVFSDCSGLTSVTIPNSVPSIGNGAFYGCSGLTSVTIPNSVTSIGDDAFSDCSSLTSVTIPNSVTSIHYRAFCRCAGLSSIVVASGNSKYDSRNNCNAIIETSTNTLITGCNNTIIPNSVTSIGTVAFWGSGLTSITIPSSVTSIGSGAFLNCTGLTTVNFNATNCTISANVFWTSQPSVIDNPVFRGCTAFSTLNIGNNVTKIPAWTFVGCALSGNITIPNSVTSIGHYAFSYCHNVTSVTIGTGVGSIGYGAFYLCTRLSTINYNAVNCNIDLPTSYTSNYYPFRDCPLSRVFIGENVQKIPDYAFYGSSHPTEAHFLCFQPPTMNYGNTPTDPGRNPGCGILYSHDSDVTFYVPCGAAINYSRYASYCKEFIEDCGGGTQAIDDIIGNDTKIFSRGSDIVIESSDNTDALVYDTKGRIIYHGRIESPIHVNQSGVYMVKLGNNKPQKVIVGR